MAVFPDRIVLKNSGDDDATVRGAISPGGTDEIVVGELVLRHENGGAELYTLGSDGSIVTVSSSGTAGQINSDTITSATPPTQRGNGNGALREGDTWYNSNTGALFVWYNNGSTTDWTEVVGAGGGGGVGEAPLDGQQYARKDGDWEVVAPSALINDPSPTLGADLNVDTFAVTSPPGEDIVFKPGDGGVTVYGNGTLPSSATLLNEDNTSGLTIAAPIGSYGYSMVLPNNIGSPGQVLTTDGSGVLQWTTPAGAGGGTAPTVLSSTINSNSSPKSSLELLRPNIVVAGGMLVAAVIHRMSAGALTGPEGWDFRGSSFLNTDLPTATSSQHVAIYTKSIYDVQPNSYTWTTPLSDVMAGLIVSVGTDSILADVETAVADGNTVQIDADADVLNIFVSTWLETDESGPETYLHTGPISLGEVSDSPQTAARIAGSYVANSTATLTATHETVAAGDKHGIVKLSLTGPPYVRDTTGTGVYGRSANAWTPLTLVEDVDVINGGTFGSG